MRNWQLIGVMAGLLVASSAFALESEALNPKPTPLIEATSKGKIHWVVALNLGGAIAQPGKTQTLAAYGGSNNYANTTSLQTSLLGGAFVGLDIPLSPLFNYQVGLAYNTVSPYTLKGQIQQYGEAQFTGFDYQYQVQSQQLFFRIKIIIECDASCASLCIPRFR